MVGSLATGFQYPSTWMISNLPASKASCSSFLSHRDLLILKLKQDMVYLVAPMLQSSPPPWTRPCQSANPVLCRAVQCPIRASNLRPAITPCDHSSIIDPLYNQPLAPMPPFAAGDENRINHSREPSSSSSSSLPNHNPQSSWLITVHRLDDQVSFLSLPLSLSLSLPTHSQPHFDKKKVTRQRNRPKVIHQPLPGPDANETSFLSSPRLRFLLLSPSGQSMTDRINHFSSSYDSMITLIVVTE
jgi:hypothetical protein